jgi:hypothetical protein
MRKLSELYRIVLEDFITNNAEDNNYVRCLCFTIKRLSYIYTQKITINEKEHLFINLRENYPNITSRFFWNNSFTGKINGYWWNLNKKGYDQRVKFLKHLIKKYESNNN